VDRQARRVRQLRGGLALCLAVLLTLTPFAQRFPTLSARTALAVAAASDEPGGRAARGEETVLTLQDPQPRSGILPRLLYVEGALAAAPPKAPFPTLHNTRDSPVSPGAARTLRHDARNDFHQSSVGTARQPTGPPA
jgi:hypothetical protein